MSRYIQALSVGVVAAATVAWLAFDRPSQVVQSSVDAEIPAARPDPGGFTSAAAADVGSPDRVPVVSGQAPAAEPHDRPTSGYGERWREESEPAFAEFRAWTDQFRDASEAERAEMVARGVSLAEIRRSALRNLIQQQPRAALGLAVPLEVRDLLPPEVKAQLESRVAGTGDLSVVVAAGVQRTVRLNGSYYFGHVYGRRETQPSEYGVSLHGIAVDGHLALHESPVRWLEPGEAPAEGARSLEASSATAALPKDGAPTAAVASAQVYGQDVALRTREEASTLEAMLVQAENEPGPYTPILFSGAFDHQPQPPRGPSPWTTGDKKVLVLPIDFVDRPGWPPSVPDGNIPITPQMLRDRFATQVIPYFTAQSYGRTQLQVTVADKLYRPRYEAELYVLEGIAQWMHDDVLAVADADWDFAAYDVIMLVHRDLSEFPSAWDEFFQYRGGAEVGGKRVWINGWPSAEVLAHELAHSYGVWHADAYATRPEPFEGLHLPINNGDPFDLMGAEESLAKGLNAVFKHRLGWLSSTEVRDSSESATHRLFRSDGAAPPSGGIAGVRIQRSGVEFWISYQKPAAVNGGTPTPGAFLHAYEGANTVLYDLSPDSPLSDASLPVGASITHEAQGFSIRPLGQGTQDGREYLDVEIVESRGEYPVRAWPILGRAGEVPYHYRWLEIEQVVAVDSSGGWALATDGSVHEWGYLGSIDFPPERGPTARIFASTSGGYAAGLIDTSGHVVFGSAAAPIDNPPAGALTGVVRAAIAPRHAIVLKNDGSVIAWGDNATGAANVPAELTGVVDVAATREGSCALLADGTVVSWGNLRPTPSEIGRVLAITTTRSSIVGLRWNGTVAEWGDPSGAWTIYHSLGSDLRSVAASPEDGLLAIRENGTLVAWSSVTPIPAKLIIPPNLPPVLAVAVGGSAAAAILNQGAPAITVQPYDRFVPQFTSLKFTAFAVGTGGKLSYRWQRLKPGFITWEDLRSTENFRGAYSHTLQVSSVRGQQSGERYRCVVTENGVSVTSDDAQVLVEGALVGIAQQPSGQTVNIGATATLSVKPFGVSPFAYQWYKDGAPLAGRTGPQLVIRNVRSSHAGSYTVTVGNEHGVVMSNPARLVVRR